MPYTFDSDALKRANGGILPTESATFQRNYNGTNRNHDTADIDHRLIIDQHGNIVGETVFVKRPNANGRAQGIEASLLTAINDPRFSVSINDGRFNITGPEGANLRTIAVPSRATPNDNIVIDRDANRVRVRSGNVTDIPAAEVIPAQYTRGQHYDYHAYFYLPRGRAPNADGSTNVSRVLLRETTPLPGGMDPVPAGRTGRLGEVYITEGSADLTLDYQRQMRDPVKFIQAGGGHNRITFVGALAASDISQEGTLRLGGGGRDARNPRVELLNGIPATLDIAFGTRNAAGVLETTQPYRAANGGRMQAGDLAEFNRAVERTRQLPRTAPTPQPAHNQERRQNAPEPSEEISALPPEVARQLNEAAALLQRGMDPAQSTPHMIAAQGDARRSALKL